MVGELRKKSVKRRGGSKREIGMGLYYSREKIGDYCRPALTQHFSLIQPINQQQSASA
jgi:hypothetical protein